MDGRPPSLRAAEIVDYRHEHVEVITRETVPSLLVLADSCYPGWQAEIDDVPTPVLRVNHLLRGVVVPEGVHHGTFTFKLAS